MFEALNLYCERSSSEFWAEPLNAITNAAFIIAAWFVWRRARRTGDVSLGVRLLLALMLAIGIGSGLFHTYANKLTQFLDILPILIFQLVYLWLYCYRIISIRAAYVAGIVLVFLLSAMIGIQFRYLLNGSIIYAPAVIMLLALGIYHAATGKAERYAILGALALFVFSMASRTADAAYCFAFPLGTHFIWHLCNAMVLYILLSGFLSNQPAGQRFGSKRLA